MYILGLNAYHADSSACLVCDGKLISAVEEERFRRTKHYAGLPTQAINYCLENAGINLSNIDHISINADPRSHFLRKVGYTLKNRPNISFLLNRFRNKSQRASIKDSLSHAFPGANLSAEIHFIEHHLSHLASAHLVSGFDESMSVSIDGFGDFSSGAWGIALGSDIHIQNQVFFPHSMGIFYQALTQYLGFPNYGDEYKVMGLAPYGKPTFLDKLRNVVFLQNDGSYKLNLDLFSHHKGNVSFEWSNGSPEIGCLFSSDMEQMLGIPPRFHGQPLEKEHHDLAHSIQAMYEEAFFNLLEVTHSKNGIDNLTLAGGCAMNSVANGKVFRSSPYKKVYVQSAAGDAGGAIGSAYVVAARLNSNAGRFHMNHAYWGPSFDNQYHKNLLEEKKSELEGSSCNISFFESNIDLCAETAKAISDGKVIGWFQGRMEWGPRALGNRSILGDPRRSDMKDILNHKIKRRESFRPFAPSILRENVAEWFEEEEDVPFMMQVFQVRKGKRQVIPAVTHVDGSGRLQTVEREANSIYHCLIHEFQKLTGVPIILNTSFNENEPIVCKPEEALDCFLRTKMDVLVLGNWLILRN